MNYQTAVKMTDGIIDTKIDSTIQANTVFANMNNVAKFDDYFGQRPGRTAYGTASGIVMEYYHFDIGDIDKFMKFTTTGIYTRSSSGWTDVSGSALTGAYTNYIDACTVYDSITGTAYVVFTNGVDNIRKYTGTGNTSDLSAWTSYKARFLRYYKGYLCAYHLTDGGVRYGFRMRCSAIDKPNDVTSTGSTTFNLDQDRNVADIVAVEFFDDYIAIFKTDCIYLQYLGSSQDIFNFDVVVHKTGLRASRALATYKDGGLFFLGYDDVYYWASPNSRPMPLTTRLIRNRLFDDTSATNLKNALMVYDQQFNQIKLYVPEGTYQNRVYTLDLTEQKWSWWKSSCSNITAVSQYLVRSIVSIDDLTTDYGTIDDMTGTQIDDLSGALVANFPLLIEGDKNGASWYENKDAFNDGNITISSDCETKDYLFQSGDIPFTSDQLLALRFEAKGAQTSGDRLYLYYSEDEGTTWTQITSGLNLADFSVWDEEYIELTSSWAFYEAHVNIVTDKVRFKFANAINNSTWFVRKVAVATEDGDPE